MTYSQSNHNFKNDNVNIYIKFWYDDLQPIKSQL